MELLPQLYRNLGNAVLRAQLWKEQHGQDLIEYALMAGFVAVAAGALMPEIALWISIVFRKAGRVLRQAARQGGGGGPRPTDPFPIF